MPLGAVLIFEIPLELMADEADDHVPLLLSEQAYHIRRLNIEEVTTECQASILLDIDAEVEIAPLSPVEYLARKHDVLSVLLLVNDEDLPLADLVLAELMLGVNGVAALVDFVLDLILVAIDNKGLVVQEHYGQLGSLYNGIVVASIAHF